MGQNSSHRPQIYEFYDFFYIKYIFSLASGKSSKILDNFAQSLGEIRRSPR